MDELLITIGSPGASTTENDSYVELTVLNAADLTAITSATASLDLYDTDGVALTGISLPVTITHVASGVYRGTVGKNLVVPTNMLGKYKIVVTDTFTRTLYGRCRFVEVQ